MGEQFKVVPEALRRAQMAFDYAQQEWGMLIDGGNGLPAWKLDGNDLGLIGRMSNIIQEYNAVVDDLTEKVRAGQHGLKSTGEALRGVARNYEAVDEEYYAKFGWIERDLDEVAPPPS